jgi:hypothetical protein
MSNTDADNITSQNELTANDFYGQYMDMFPEMYLSHKSNITCYYDMYLPRKKYILR